MSQAIDIMNELEKEFDKEKAKVLTNAILKREEEGNLVTKDYLHKEMNGLRVDMNGLKAEFYKEISATRDDLRKEMSGLKDDLRKEMSGLKDDLRKEMSGLKDDLRKEMSQGFIDVHKAIIDVQKSVTDVQKSITRMTIFFISAIGTIAIIFKVLDIAFGK